jgi:predicted DNA-binding protein
MVAEALWKRSELPRANQNATGCMSLEKARLKNLDALLDRTGAPVAELIRRTIDEYLQERAKELK